MPCGLEQEHLEAEYRRCLNEGDTDGMARAHGELIELLQKTRDADLEEEGPEASDKNGSNGFSDDLQEIIRAAREQAAKAQQEAESLEVEYEARRAKDIAARLSGVDIPILTESAEQEIREELSAKHQGKDRSMETSDELLPVNGHSVETPEQPALTNDAFETTEIPALTSGSAEISESPTPTNGSIEISETPTPTNGSIEISESPTPTNGSIEISETPTPINGSVEISETPTLTTETSETLAPAKDLSLETSETLKPIDITVTSVEFPPKPANLPVRVPGTYYEIFGIDRFTTGARIESVFLRKVRHLLRSDSLSRHDRQTLITLSVARDVLKDENSRDDHDFRLLERARQATAVSRRASERAEQEKKNKEIVIEAVQLTDIIEESELQLAREMHDPKSLHSFAEFLIENEMVKRVELEAAIMSRALLKQGRLQSAPLKQAFKAMRTLGVDFVDSLLVSIDTNLDEILALAKELQLTALQKQVKMRRDVHNTTGGELDAFPSFDDEETQLAQKALRSMLLADNQE